MCATNGEREEAPLWLLHFFIERASTSVLFDNTGLWSKSQSRQLEGTVTSYTEAINYLLEMYATDDVIAKTDAGMITFTHPLN